VILHGAGRTPSPPTREVSSRPEKRRAAPGAEKVGFLLLILLVMKPSARAVRSETELAGTC
jgi:hypothetical protein